MKTVESKKSTFKGLRAPLAGVIAGALVLALFNAQLLATRVYLWQHPVANNPVTKVAEAAPAIKVSPEPKIIIEKLGVEAPVIYDMDRIDDASVQESLRHGVLQFADTAVPGERGNIVIVGHSSNVPWAAGGYKFIFTLLDQLHTGDQVILHYQGLRYVYRVTGTKIISPYDVSVLQQTDTPQLTLITCSPAGTNKNRLVVTAEQISPSPSTATERTTGTSTNEGTVLPGQGSAVLPLR